MSQSAFIGDWRVTEYVYTPAGEFVGYIRQERTLWPTQQALRIRQICAPVEEAPGLSAEARRVCAAFNRRTGTYVFDIYTEGRARHYRGPAVLGSGRLWREGVLTARGLWPDLGYTFTSFSFMVHPHRQITGGRFTLAGRELCTLVGVAVPSQQPYAELAAPAPVVGPGHLWTMHPDGTPLSEAPITLAELNHDFDPATGQGGWAGASARYGHLTWSEAVNSLGHSLSWLDVADGPCRVGWRSLTSAEQVCQVQVYTFLPETPAQVNQA